MKNGLILIVFLLVGILLCVQFQFGRTRRAMAEFSGQHGMTYSKPRWNLLGIGTIEGNIDSAGFFMGSKSSKYTFGPVAAAHCPDEESIFMCMTVEHMPLHMVIRRRGKGVQGHAVEMVLSRTGYSLVRTRDQGFDTRFDVIGNEKEVTAWLTDRRRGILKTFLSIKGCAVAGGSLRMEFTGSFIGLDDLESALLHIRESLLHLDSEPMTDRRGLQDR